MAFIRPYDLPIISFMTDITEWSLENTDPADHPDSESSIWNPATTPRDWRESLTLSRVWVDQGYVWVCDEQI